MLHADEVDIIMVTEGRSVCLMKDGSVRWRLYEDGDWE